MARKYEFTQTEVANLHKLVDSEIKTYKNWIVSAVEAGNEQYGDTGLTGFAYAQKLTAELRNWQELFKKTNVEAHKSIDKMPV